MQRGPERPIVEPGGPRCKAHSAMQKALACAADAEYRDCSCFSASRRAKWQTYRKDKLHRPCQQCCLTPRSRRGPTASHQARAGGTRYIFTGPGLASCRRSRFNSNVRPHSRSPPYEFRPTFPPQWRSKTGPELGAMVQSNRRPTSHDCASMVRGNAVMR